MLYMTFLSKYTLYIKIYIIFLHKKQQKTQYEYLIFIERNQEDSLLFERKTLEFSQNIVPPTLLSEKISFEGESKG